jgi:hypothetical protein
VAAARRGEYHRDSNERPASKGPTMLRGNVLRIVAWLSALLPLGLVIHLVCAYKVEIPYQDQWEMVPIVARAMHGGLRFDDLWKLLNEHRLVIPKLIMVGLAVRTRWNLDCELALNFLLAGGIFALLARMMERDLRKLGEPHAWLAAPICAWMLFSLKQFENWLWGFQFFFFLCVLVCLGGVAVLARAPLRWGRLWIAAALGCIATFTMALALIYWFVGLAVLAVIRTERPRLRLKAVAVWSIVALAILALYFTGYRRPPLDESPFYFLGHPIRYAVFVLIVLGAPLGGSLAAAMGAVGVALNLAVLALQWRRRWAAWEVFLPYWTIAAFALTGVLFISAGRVHFGFDQARVTRYVTLVMPFWVVTIFNLLAARRALLDPAGGESRWTSALRRAALGACLAIGAMALHSSIHAVRYFREFHARMAPAQEALVRGDGDDALLARIFPNPPRVRQYGQILRENRLTVFRHAPDDP